jgi:DNA-binding NarL/FixJ family response regulator
LIVDALMVVEDLAPVRTWLSGVLSRLHPGPRVAECGTLEEAMRWLVAQPAGARALCLVDLGLPDGSGLTFIQRLTERMPAAQAVVTTLYDDDANVIAAMAAGAAGYLLKDGEEDALERRLAAMRDGEVPMSPAVSRRILSCFRANAGYFAPDGPPVLLTAREQDVLRLIGRGLRNAEVGGTLGISALTVAGYVKAIYRKLGVASRAEAAAEAMRRGLV